VSVAVIGMGVVGRAQEKLFGDVVTYDIAREEPYPAGAIAGCEFAVIAVGTPQGPGGHADVSAVRAAIGALPAGLPALVRSTVPPGTTDGLARGCPGRLVAHAPEFLTERSDGPWPGSADVPYLILGGSPEARQFFRPRLDMSFPGVIWECTATEAELAKYTANLHWAARVTFVNEMARVCAAAGADWEQVRAAWLCDTRVRPAYTAMAGFPPGFGGSCWPKDLAALIAASTEAGYDPVFLRAVSEANGRFREER
jgi:UDPglucose 6-dehydrogenase